MVKIIKDFVSKEDCFAIIDYLERLIVSGEAHIQNDKRICIVNKTDPFISPLVEKYTNKTITLMNDKYTKFNGFIITKYVEGVGMANHVDSLKDEEMGALMYLNEDYEGGELTYSDDKGSHFMKPESGSMVYFPSWYTHGVNPVTKGIRYFFTISLLG